jgi:hypothetical protein
MNSILKRQLTIQQRNERIASGQLSEADVRYLERKRERKQMTVMRNQAAREFKAKLQQKKRQLNQELKKKLQLEKRSKRLQGNIITKQHNRLLCVYCNASPAKPNGLSKNGFQKWHKYCVSCAKIAYDAKFKHLQNKKSTCDECAFVPKDACQLDLVFIDGDKTNKEISNLTTLCANCSRLHMKKIKNQKKSVLNVTVDSDVRI